ncbi:ATP-binding cassette sub-family G member 1 [Blattella germanica]|nr:ATP-binding cassette sub-family G member 1 [Blattella germanica]
MEGTSDQVDEILLLLGLQKGKNTLVGKLSGGEQKRLSIGVELLTNPPIMFFDEPTSGLDSSSSLQVISYLKSLSQTGRTVICTIHQPSSRLFEMFDDIYLLSQGQCLYSGPLDQLTAVFEEEGFTCPKYFNRADFVIEVSSKESGSNVERLVQRFKKPQPITYSTQKQESENSDLPNCFSTFWLFPDWAAN